MKAEEVQQRQAAAMSEADLQELVRDTCKRLRLRYYHTFDSRRSEPGFPDCVIVGPGGGIFRELKKQDGLVSPSQCEWLDAMEGAGLNTGVWRPLDWVQGRIAAELRGLR